MANRSALIALRLAGGDPIIEGQIARRISRLEAKRQCTAHPSARFAREQALARGTAQQAFRRATLQRRDDLAVVKLKIQADTLALDKLKLEARVDNTVLRAAKQKLDREKKAGKGEGET